MENVNLKFFLGLLFFWGGGQTFGAKGSSRTAVTDGNAFSYWQMLWKSEGHALPGRPMQGQLAACVPDLHSFPPPLLLCPLFPLEPLLLTSKFCGKQDKTEGSKNKQRTGQHPKPAKCMSLEFMFLDRQFTHQSVT